MAGHSRNHGAIRKSNKKGATKGSGGQRRRGLRGKGPTPKAEDRVYHKAHKRKVEQQRKTSGRHDRRNLHGSELVVGRNPVVECLRAKVPATALYVAEGTDNDDRLTEAVRVAGDRAITVLEVPRIELDRMTGNGMHQGLGLLVPEYQYVDVQDLIDRAHASSSPGLIVCLDNITDPRNLGAVIRSVAAFGGHGVVIPERRSASVTAVAWRTSAGTAGRLPRREGDEYDSRAQAVPKRGLSGRRFGCRRGPYFGYLRRDDAGGGGRRVRGQGPVPFGVRDV